MILMLTYHRIRRPNDATGNDFYTIAESEFAAQLKALCAGRFRAMDFSKLEADPLDENAPQFALSFDDGTADHFDSVAPLLDAAGCRGIFFVPTAKLNKPGYLSDVQLRELADRGHVIGCHSHEHRRMDGLDREGMRQQINTSLDILAEKTGVRPSWFAPPGGFINGMLRDVARECGIKVIRTMEWGFNKTIDPFSLQCIPMNRSISAGRFATILEGRSLKWFRCLYAGKEALKKVLPMGGYSRLRDSLLRVSSGR